MTISVIIPTYNAEKYLPALLEKLKQQTLSFELIIIDSSSVDDTVNIANTYTDTIIIIPTEEFDHGGTRTKVAMRAKGDIVVFLTQDALPYDDTAIERLVESFHDTDVAASYGRQLPYASTSLFGKHLRDFNYRAVSYKRSMDDAKAYGIKTAFLSDSFAAYRKSVLEELGWFKDGLILGEDTYVGAKVIMAGHSIYYNAEAQVYHSHSYTLLQEFRRYFDIGVFHKNESWILDTFGKAEGEGMKYVKSELKFLIDNNAYLKIPEFFIRNGLKFIGYKLGQRYNSLPIELSKKLSMHKRWWDKKR